MQSSVRISIPPAQTGQDGFIRSVIARQLGVEEMQITGYYPLRSSIDARGKQPRLNVSYQVFVDEPFQQRELRAIHLDNVRDSLRTVLIAGSGPAGLFAALKLIEQGIRPIILERGKDVRSRRRDLALLNREGIVNPESNYCFGEGGAGTYSDGKLYTRSSKRGDVSRILNILVQFGADENILYESHPHIGTNKLPHIISSIRETIMGCGGEIHFETKLTDIVLEGDRVAGVKTSQGDILKGDALILATGHSARDIFHLLYQKKITIECKPFALGVRVEHPQDLIDRIQYHCVVRDENLPPANYSLVKQVEGHGVFSFCMCPGGIIAPASTAPGEIVVNGWSPSKRNNPFANSGMVVSVEPKDMIPWLNKNPHYSHMIKRDHRNMHPLLGIWFQESVERKAFELGGGHLVAPAQRMVDFTRGIFSGSLPGCSYLPGIRSASLQEILPPFIYKGLAGALPSWGKTMKGYFTNEAVLVAAESRTSSPVRIPRDPVTLEHVQIKGLYPCGEGAGYAGGIVSAAMDGEKVAAQLIKMLTH